MGNKIYAPRFWDKINNMKKLAKNANSTHHIIKIEIWKMKGKNMAVLLKYRVLQQDIPAGYGDPDSSF